MVGKANFPDGTSLTRLRLVICYSPFQAYVWLLISQQKFIINIRVLYITSRDTSIDIFYVEKLRKSFEFVEYFVIRGRLWRSLPELKRRLNNLNVNGKEIDLYLASFNTFFSMYIFNKLNINSIFLFDDGIYSIISELERRPYRFNFKRFGFFRRIQYKILLAEGNDQKILNMVRKFYTLFPISQTLTERSLVEPIKMPVIDNVLNNEMVGIERETRIFIGDVVYELAPSMRRDYTNLLSILHLDYYLPHPRSRNDGVVVKQSVIINEVAEEFIFRLLNTGHKVVVYSFSSTVLFTLGTHPALIKLIIKHPDMANSSIFSIAPSYEIGIVDYNVLIFEIESESKV